MGVWRSETSMSAAVVLAVERPLATLVAAAVTSLTLAASSVPLGCSPTTLDAGSIGVHWEVADRHRVDL